MTEGGDPAVVFGPVPSRRLGSSLGVNTIPPKHCSYSCVYCQLGRTSRMTVERRAFRLPEEVVAAVQDRLEECERRGVAVDYVTLVPDGEPTLDLHLGQLIEDLGALGPAVAVITNGSLLDREDVRAELAQADWVSVKLDAADATTWRRVDRPSRRLDHERVVAGLESLAGSFGGTLVTETMLVAGVNDQPTAVTAIAERLAGVRPAIAYLAVPMRPPAEPTVRAPGSHSLVRAFAILSQGVPRVELLVGDPVGRLSPSDDLERDLLAITAVHPLDEGGVVELGGGSLRALDVAVQLVAKGALQVEVFRGRRYFVRSFSRQWTPAGREAPDPPSAPAQ